jgi:hypothetical protein
MLGGRNRSGAACVSKTVGHAFSLSLSVACESLVSSLTRTLCH